MTGKEQRKEKRIPAAQLPSKYRRFSVKLANGQLTEVECKDASSEGFCLVSDRPPEEFAIGSRVVLYPSGVEHPIYAEIISSEKLESGTRNGILIHRIGGYHLYDSDYSLLKLKIEKET